MTLTPDINSFSYIVRDGILERLKTFPTFSSVKKWSRNRMKGPIQGGEIPYFGVYFTEETMTPDGDPNAGAPKFTHHLKLTFQVVIQCNDNDVAEQNLDTAHWAIMNYLHRQDWFRFPMPTPITHVDIEGIERGFRKHQFGNAGLNNETPVAELQMDLTLKFRTYFEPYVPDDFNRMHVTVAHPWPYDPGAYDPPFTMVYDLMENTEQPVDDYSLNSPQFATPTLAQNMLPLDDYSLNSPDFATPSLTVL
jgi:hypothetical protein